MVVAAKIVVVVFAAVVVAIEYIEVEVAVPEDVGTAEVTKVGPFGIVVVPVLVVEPME